MLQKMPPALSTLIKGIAGIYPFDSGEYFFEGRPAQVHDPKQANDLGIEVVYQDLALCDNLDVVHNMFLGREESKGGTLDEIEMEKRATETLKGLSVRTLKSVRMQVSSLSGGQRQTVAIARAVLWNSKMVILDEPTAALGVAQISSFEQFFDPRLKGRVAVLSETMDTMGLMLAWQGDDPADFTDAQFDDARMALALAPNPDILAEVAALPGGPFCVGFAAETENLKAYATEKRRRKGIPLLAANLATDTFGRDDNALILFDDAGEH